MEQSAQPADPATRNVVAPGLKVLIQGAESTATQPAPAAKAGRTPERVLYAAILLIADAALVLWPVAWLHAHAGAVSILLLIACLLSAVFGAAAGVLAILTLSE